MTNSARRTLLLLALGWITTTSSLVGGCTDLFKPRTPPPPAQEGLRIDYGSPDSTLQTISRAIVAKGTGNSLTAYLGGMADSVADGHYYFAYFDPEAALAWVNLTGRALPDPWGIELEERFFGKLSSLNLNSDYDMAWLRDEFHPNDDDEVLGPNQHLLHRQYLLRTLPDAAGKVDTLAIGYADLYFTKSVTADKWVIQRWQDRVDPAIGVNPVNPNHLSFSTRRLGVY